MKIFGPINLIICVKGFSIVLFIFIETKQCIKDLIELKIPWWSTKKVIEK